MADVNPQATDFQNSPSHSFQHRVYATDSLATAAAVRVDSANNFVVTSGSGNFMRFGDQAELTGTMRAFLTVPSPTSTDHILMLRVYDSPITVRQLVVTITGTNTPGITVNVRHALSRGMTGSNGLLGSPVESNAGNSATSSGHSTTDFSSGDATVPAQSYMVLDLTGNTGQTEQVELSLYFTQDLTNT